MLRQLDARFITQHGGRAGMSGDGQAGISFIQQAVECGAADVHQFSDRWKQVYQTN